MGARDVSAVADAYTPQEAPPKFREHAGRVAQNPAPRNRVRDAMLARKAEGFEPRSGRSPGRRQRPKETAMFDWKGIIHDFTILIAKYSVIGLAAYGAGNLAWKVLL